MNATRPLLAALAGLIILPLSARTFTSADGTKTIEAELIDYRPASGTVVIRYEGRNTRHTVKADAFSEKDLEYFKQFLKEQTMRNSLRITTEEREERSKDEGEIYTYTRLSSHFTVAIRNAGDLTVEGLSAKYDIYVQRYDEEGSRQVEVVSGEQPLDPIPVNLNTLFETETVKLTVDCESNSSCPTCVGHAASVKRERILGLRVRLYNEEDEPMSEYHSSSSVRSIAEDEDAKQRS